jgi:hypothetical protein
MANTSYRTVKFSEVQIGQQFRPITLGVMSWHTLVKTEDVKDSSGRWNAVTENNVRLHYKQTEDVAIPCSN